MSNDEFLSRRIITIIPSIYGLIFGYLIGVIVGYALAIGITFYSDWETAISLWSVILSFGVSSAVGVIFGYYPAKQASELNPIEALRYE